MTDLGQDTCGARIEVSTHEGRVRRCVLADGHYREDTPTGRTRVSWHTDCPNVVGEGAPLSGDVGHSHGPGHASHYECLVWNDHASGAHPAGVTPAEPATARCTANMCNNRDPHQHGDACGSWCPCKATVKESGRTLGTEITGGYHAELKIADAGLSVYGPARFVARVINAAGDAFEEEAER